MHSHDEAHAGAFGAERAANYDAQAKSVFPGWEALHDVVAATLATALEGRDAAALLCVGVGTGQDVLSAARYAAPDWRFTGVDPSSPMLEVAQRRLGEAGLLARTLLHAGELHTLPEGPAFDGAVMMGVLHHVVGEGAQLALLREVRRRLVPGAPLLLGARVGHAPELQAVEDFRLRRSGMSAEQLHQRHQAHAKLEAPASELALAELLGRAGFSPPLQIFASLGFRVFVTRAS